MSFQSVFGEIKKTLGIRTRDKRKGEFCAQPMEQLELETTKEYWKETCLLTNSGQTVDDTTWNDLDMDLVYESLRFTCSTIGDEILYAMLRDTDVPQEALEQRRLMMDAFADGTYREKIRKIMGRQSRQAYHGAGTYLFHPKDKVPGKLALYMALPIVLVVFLVLGFVNPIFFFGVACSFAVNLIVYYYSGSLWMREITAVRHIARVINVATKLAPQLPDSLSDVAAQLRTLTDEMKPVARWNALFAMQKITDMDYLIDYIRILFQLDMICLNKLAVFFSNHSSTLRRLYQLVGEIDAYQAIAAYRLSGVMYCEPIFDSKLEVEAKGLAHPLVAAPVRNDLDWTRSVLITGANASGKSTFTKTMAVNAILAQSILTCTAERFVMPRAHIMTSMAMRDSLQSGESYFIVEIRSLKRIVDALEQLRPVLCFIDEILRGTNTIERISASQALLKYIAGQNCLCMAATHDLELTRLLPEYRQMHFREDLTEEGMHFSFKIIEGPSNTRNAIALLSLMHFPETVTQSAAQVAEEFAQTGQWTG
ncbi:MAG: hypothetical protein GX096_06565 [Clostridiales bacterium]|nr:hypothetical protein [Clostridiales bacterium]